MNVAAITICDVVQVLPTASLKLPGRWKNTPREVCRSANSAARPWVSFSHVNLIRPPEHGRGMTWLRHLVDRRQSPDEELHALDVMQAELFSAAETTWVAEIA
jgi:hypothetical protein